MLYRSDNDVGAAVQDAVGYSCPSSALLNYSPDVFDYFHQLRPATKKN
ncbi:hypothetical protein CGLO_04920 [Colletotrichum gloeosporioides Cg-14]|uniref:Uncharacterized protein n=1 Tax=Colletotrichum gloeosporioides (strain Cg-14) TaxID=1237896 RepID=T0KII5_COLGC|nr:hypothetical protein CGLO_04920 [Colletotrichum gloeosporioides Cg-14]